jgi:nucleoside phosphorylase
MDAQPFAPTSVDVIIVTALDEERHWIQKVFAAEWRAASVDQMAFYFANFLAEDRQISLAVTTQIQMGMPHAAIHTTRAITALNPKFVAMSGICAGVEGKVKLGDVLIAANIFDCGSGKVMKGKLHPHFVPVLLEPWLWQLLNVMADDGATSQQIFDEYPTPANRPPEPISIRLGDMASGAAVIADASVIDTLTQLDRKLLGVDMEGYSVALAGRMASTPGRAIPTIVLKGVTDFASIHKGDDFHDFAAYASAAFLKKFLAKHADTLELGGLSKAYA